MPTLTDAQKALLAEHGAEAKLALEINTATPLRYCSYDDPVQIDSNWYSPWNMDGDPIEITSPFSARTVVRLADQDGDLRTAWYSEQWSELAVEVHVLLRKPGTTWTEIISIDWKCEYCSFDRHANFFAHLYAAVGHRQRAGLVLGTRAEFEYAPEPGESVRVNDNAIHFPDVGAGRRVWRSATRWTGGG
jgi:hypothetical protein